MATSRTRRVAKPKEEEITPQQLVDLGLVEFFEDGDARWYEVGRPDSGEIYVVDRDEKRRVRCTCPEYEHAGGAEVAFDCLDKKAVKLFMKDKENRMPKTTDEEMTFESAGSKKTSDAGHRKQSGAALSWLAALAAPIEPELIKQRPGWTDKQGNQVYVDYIEWHTVVERFNRVLQDRWSSTVTMPEVHETGDNRKPFLVVVKATISIHLDDTSPPIVREGIGTSDELSEMGIKGAEHDALKRAALKYGTGIELYFKDDRSEEPAYQRQSTGGRQPQPASTPVSRAAASRGRGQSAPQAGAGEVTPKQLGLIRNLAREKGVDAEEECFEITGKEPEDLSKREASDFIGHLQNLEDFG